MTEPELAPHQLLAVKELATGKILKGGVGTGKTRTAMAYYARLAPWVKLYVITTAKKRDSGDWEAEARLFGCEPMVDSWNNLDSYSGVHGAFFIFDEQRVVGSGVWVKAFLEITKANDWILLSATPGDSWMDYIPVFIANGFYKNRTEFLREHVVFDRWAKFPKVESYRGTAKLADRLAHILVEMPYERHTTRHMTDVYAEYDKEKLKSVMVRRWNYLEQRPVRHVSELFSLARRVVYSDPSRLQRIRDLLVRHPRVIIFYNFDYELELLRELDVEKAEWNGHRHQPIPDGDEWAYLVQYTSGAEGWNCTTTDTIIFYSLTYSYRLWEQAQGRTDRMDTPFTDLRYYILRSPSVIDSAVMRALEAKRDFNEQELKLGITAF